jgi:hypothetical protein
MPAGALEIEVTESMLVEGGKAAVEALNQLAADGVLIAIDDFGTGYSSFSYLKTMPAKVLKLDMSFLVDAQHDNDAGKIVAAIINMAHALQKEVVAEGIERVDQLKLLKSLGCERGQGYLFGKPVPADHIARTFRAEAPPLSLSGEALAVLTVSPSAAAVTAFVAAAGEPAAAPFPAAAEAAAAETSSKTAVVADAAQGAEAAPGAAGVDAAPSGVSEPVTAERGAEPDADVPVLSALIAEHNGALSLSTGDVLERAAQALAGFTDDAPSTAEHAQDLVSTLSAERAATLDELSNRGEPGTVLMPLTAFGELSVNSTVQPDTAGLAALNEKSESNAEAMS